MPACRATSHPLQVKSPPLSTLSPRRRKEAQAAMHLLLSRIAGADLATRPKKKHQAVS